MRARLERAWRDFDRVGDPGIAVCRLGTFASGGGDSSRPLVGSVDDVIADVEAYLDAGATRLVVSSRNLAVDAQVGYLERFGAKVMPSFS